MYTIEITSAKDIIEIIMSIIFPITNDKKLISLLKFKEVKSAFQNSFLLTLATQ